MNIVKENFLSGLPTQIPIKRFQLFSQPEIVVSLL